jgi:type II secretion system protein J
MRSQLALQKALTLVELMIAMVLLSIISMICYGILQMAFSMWERSNTVQETLQQGQIALAHIAADVRCAYIQRSTGSDSPTGAANEKKSGDKNKKKIFFRGTAGVLQGKTADSICFMRPGNKGLAEVRYSIKTETAEEEVSQLMRRHNPVTKGYVASDEADDNATITVLLKNVSELSFRYLTENNQWVSTWPTIDEKTSTTLPKAVSISLVLRLPNTQKDFPLPAVMVRLPLGGKDYTQEKKK